MGAVMDRIKRKLYRNVFKLTLETTVPLPFTKAEVYFMDISSHGAFIFRASVW